MSLSVDDRKKNYRLACSLENSLTKLDIIADDYTVNRISDKRMSEVLFTIEYGMKSLGVSNLLNSERYVYDKKEVDGLLKKLKIDKNNPREYTDEVRNRCYDEVFLKHFIEDTSMKLAVRKMQLGDGAYGINDTYAKDSEVVNNIKLEKCNSADFLHLVRCKSQIETIAYMAEDYAGSLYNEEEVFKEVEKLDEYMKKAGMESVNKDTVAIQAEKLVDDIYEANDGPYHVTPATHWQPAEVEIDEALYDRCHTEAYLMEYVEAAEDRLNDYIYFRKGCEHKEAVLDKAYYDAENLYEAICRTGLEKAFEKDYVKASDLGVERYTEQAMKYQNKHSTLRYQENQHTLKQVKEYFER